MGGPGSGGPREGTPGAGYANRTDLNTARQPVRAPAGQPYGARKASEDAQRVVPLPDNVAFDGPTARPGEPVTSGLPVGAGPGPESLGLTGYEGIADDTELELRELMVRFPQYQNDLARLLEYYDR